MAAVLDQPTATTMPPIGIKAHGRFLCRLAPKPRFR